MCQMHFFFYSVPDKMTKISYVGSGFQVPCLSKLAAINVTSYLHYFTLLLKNLEIPGHRKIHFFLVFGKNRISGPPCIFHVDPFVGMWSCTP